jgi:hypothetical protein
VVGQADRRIGACAFAGVVAVVALLHERLAALEITADELEAIRAALTPSELPRLSGNRRGRRFRPLRVRRLGRLLLAYERARRIRRGDRRRHLRSPPQRRAGEMLGLDGLLSLLWPLARFAPPRGVVRQAEKAILGRAGAPLIRDDPCLFAMKPA